MKPVSVKGCTYWTNLALQNLKSDVKDNILYVILVITSLVFMVWVNIKSENCGIRLEISRA